MNALSKRDLKQVNWSTVVLFTLGFWLSASFLLDAVIIPALSASGMMAEGGFASAGYLIFGVFNRIELICAALVLCSFLVFRQAHNFTSKQERWSIIFSVILVAIAIIYTYILTPQMSGMGLELNQFSANNTMPPAMISMHEGYWFLEVIKFCVCATLLSWCYRKSCTLN